ncbi:MAG: hypothetical protein RL095_3670 [Verrucomicrobiota bacterium]|jgi:methionyl-tRNA synthetase
MKKRLITSALPYVNNEPHLGNIIGCVLSADAFARFCRAKGYETLYICGTDEYGTATETKAAQEGLTPRQICDKYHAIHKKIYEHFDISFDAFGRTSSETQTGIVQDIYRQVDANGFFVEKESEQFYAESLGKFLADRLVQGTCPKCGFLDARGDQCDGCGALMTPTELLNAKCTLDGTTPVLRKTKHLYLDLPQLSDKLEAWQEESIKTGGWPLNASSTTQSWMKRGLEPRAITRDLKWGIPVPRPGYEDKVFYVWFDAPIGYVSITAHAFPNEWQKWWLAPESTELFQFMAKDNIPFHSVIFPATQLADGRNWTKCHHLASTEYLNYEDAKFSKSRGIGVFGTDVIASGIPVDLWRWYLLSVRPEKQDFAFTWQDFFDKVNGELLDIIGNLVNRSLVYLQKNFDGKLGPCAYRDEHRAFLTQVKELTAEADAAYERASLRDALQVATEIGRAGNKFFQDQQPWVAIKADKEQVQATMDALLHAVRDIAILLAPAVPETARRIGAMLGLDKLEYSTLGSSDSLKGRSIGTPEILFPKLDPKYAVELKERYSGVQQEDPFAKIQLKVGKIVEIARHPTAEHLYIEKIDLGEGRLRTICSGLVKWCKEEELLGKHVIVAANLRPADLRGVMSEGMILACSSKKDLEVLTVDAPIGSAILRANDSVPASYPDIGIDDFKLVDLKAEDGACLCGTRKLVCGDREVKTSRVLKGKLG